MFGGFSVATGGVDGGTQDDSRRPGIGAVSVTWEMTTSPRYLLNAAKVPQLRKSLAQVYWNWHYHRTAGPKFDSSANAICGRLRCVRRSGVLRRREVSRECESAAGDDV